MKFLSSNFFQNLDPDLIVLQQVPSRHYSSFHCLSTIEAVVRPQTSSSLQLLLQELTRQELMWKIDWVPLGKGSNVLISDRGFGLVVDLSLMNQISIVCEDENELILDVGAGCGNGKLLQFLRKKRCKGFGFSFGIPGTLGGGVRMNAGTPLGSFSQCTIGVSALDMGGQSMFDRELSSKDFSYRDFPAGRDWVVFRLRMRFAKASEREVEREIEDAKVKRANQPLHLPNFGSAFKNPPGDFAARLIEAAGLKERRIGDAQISSMHANFIVNLNAAKTEDALQLIELAKTTVRKKFGVQLHREVHVIGDSEYDS
ncbi:MAG: UDP-N-acetylmuramate dehydrogenase [Bdellovibrionales bacterium]|nr:UDP-N-acetylmuramate dehydrogenase [Bdellovibrionales bacterium]